MKPIEARNATWADIQGRLEGDRRAVYAALNCQEGLTTRDLAREMGWDPFSVRPRVTELCQLGLAVCVGRRRREGLYCRVEMEAWLRAQAACPTKRLGEVGSRDGRGQTAEDRGQTAEDRGQRTEGGLPYEALGRSRAPEQMLLKVGG